MSEIGAPKPNKASRKGKKSWRKNVDMTQVNEFLEEKRFEERVGGSFEDKPDDALFAIETKVEEDEPPKKERKKVKPLRCFANLEGLPGASDPKPQRPRVRQPEERENPVVAALRAGKGLGAKELGRRRDRERSRKVQEVKKEEAATRRRTKFDFDLWDEPEQPQEAQKSEGAVADGYKSEWVAPEAQTHNARANGEFTPGHAKRRNLGTGTLVPAVEVPDPGASYHPNLQDHQDLLWKATIVEIQKEKEQQKVERATTAMFPEKRQAPNENTYMKEMSEGIKELNENNDEESDESDDEGNDPDEEEDEQSLEGQFKPKTRKQKRDKRKKLFDDQRVLREKNVKLAETEIFRSKSINKEISKEEHKVEEKKEKKADKLKEKMSGPLKLSNYRFEPQDLELKLTEELTGNLRSLKQEGSVLEDRFKSLQKRNLIEVRVKQKTVKRLKRKTYEKRSHKMGWEENKNKIFKKKKNKKAKVVLAQA